jgi:hypothetical protein
MNDKMNGKLRSKNNSEKGSEFIDEDGEKFVECKSETEENENN